ncbi:unnamed protein product [Phyllotreta striolata]|uniref:Agrin n=1 Tax=Phyllotreta striolata TaxID=444603 RepID=A0A9N9TFV2_PHYSR|nr:unnamed protein product [Phyllotreta striolata]
MKYHNGPHSQSNMAASYGVYDANYRDGIYRDANYREPSYRDADYRDVTYRDNYRDADYRQPDYRETYRYEADETYVPTSTLRTSNYRGLVVNASGDSTVIRSPVAQQPAPTRPAVQDQQNSGYGGCFNSPTANPPATSDQNSFFRTWCRPTILLLFLVLLVVIFVLVSGILLYHNYLVHKPRQTASEGVLDYPEPCEKTYCAWGAQCINSPEGRGLCQCPTFCKPKVEPVCGTDGKTYTNHCELRLASCKARLNTRVKYAGSCEQNDPCRDKECNFGSRCVVNSDGRNATCVCPDKCPNYGDHTTSRAVCGSDGENYGNQCELQRAACNSQTNITIKFYGKCDPCAGVQCTEPEVCQLDEHRNPVCRCGEPCPLEFTPVCGSDGKTYSNGCSLRQEACRSRKSLNIIYRGKCSSGINPCTSVRCTRGEECVINKFGIAHCQCPESCEPIMRPVCSKDGRTFASECELKRTGCVSKTNIEIAYSGICGENGPCSEHDCQFGGTCVERAGTAHCECPDCPAEFEPICGSDGISYSNECKLRLEACKHRRNISVLYEGPCNGCENKKCDFYSECESDGTSEGRCVCPQSCADSKLNNGTICGTDGISYTSECELRMASCKTKQYVIVAYKGNCDLCQNVNCKYGGKCEAGECVCPTNCDEAGEEPVCASDMTTYRNECELQKARCARGTNAAPLTVIFYGDCREKFPSAAGSLSTTFPNISAQANPITGNDIEGSVPDNSLVDGTNTEKEACKDILCDFEATCELGPDNFPRCTCQFNCSTARESLVCASDLRIYRSLCAMKMEACQRQEELRLRPLDLCQGMEVKPCKGEKPLTDPLTERELDCGNGPFRQDCPAGSYCHQTAKFAKCCNKIEQIVDKKGCEESWYGCCPDGKTPAQGPNFGGCPSTCECNKLGSYSDICDAQTQQCQCRPGVGGTKCDRCEPGFWGLPKISTGYHGCIPCACSNFGSVRDDCEQMTGRCVCKPGVQGQKCTICTNHNKYLGPNGCVTATELAMSANPSSCSERTCHFGATCIEKTGSTHCQCHINCTNEKEPPQMVCGSDGVTYRSACNLRAQACKAQKDVVLQAFGSCKDDIQSTDWPYSNVNNPQQFTQPDEISSPLSKSTRHLLVPDPRYYYERSSNPRPVSFPDDPDFAKKESGSNILYRNRGGDFAPAYRPTPATVRVTALLGDLCSDNTDCIILNSHCVKGACLCLPNYVESSERQDCIPDTADPDEFPACSSAPCIHDSTCIDLPASTYACVCSANYTGPHCETEIAQVQYRTPAFHGRSYARLRPLKAYHKLSLEVEFKARSSDGVILYNQQKADGLGDFVSLAIINGFIEFRYNLGNGMVLIRSVDKIKLGYDHRVVIKRYHRDGVLKLDDSEEIGGESSGNLKALDLLEDAFVGFVPTNNTRVYENIGTSKGFQGCITKLKIGRQDVELSIKQEDWVLEVKGIYDCDEHACKNSPCENGGKCVKADSHAFRCDCTDHYKGDFCEEAQNQCQGDCKKDLKTRNGLTPEFNGNSFIQFPQLEGIKKKFTIEVNFMSRAANGLLLYNGQMKNGRGDFISLNIARGHLQFRFNLGSGIANITSMPITLNEWHSVRISREGRAGTLQVDNGTLVRGYSGTSLTELNLKTPLYIGSVGSWKQIHRLSGASKGFKGAIQKITLNGIPLPITQALPDCVAVVTHNVTGCSANVGYYTGPPCSLDNNPCLNSGECVPDLDNFTCKCAENYKGKYCEIVDEDSIAIRLDGMTFLQYRNRGYRSDNLTNFTDNDDEFINKTIENDESELDGDFFDEHNLDYDSEDIEVLRKPERGNRYEIKLRTFSSDGLILWRSKNKNQLQNYLSIAIVDGYPEFSFNLGRQEAFWTIRSQSKVDDGQWHSIQVRRRKRVGFISVDGQASVKGVAKAGAIALRTNAKLWIGGSSALPNDLPSAYYKGFEGCIQKISIHGKPLDLLSNSDISKISFCHDNEI